MDPLIIEAGIPIVSGLGVLAVYGWNREMVRRQSRALRLERAALDARNKELQGCVRLLGPGEAPTAAKGSGQISLVAIGTYGARNLPGLLNAFIQSGTESCVGPAQLLELDESERFRSLQAAPAVFRSRIVATLTPNYSAGMGGDDPDRVLAASEYWQEDVKASASEWISKVQRESESALLVVLVSPGGHAGLGRLPVQMYAQRYPRNPIYVVTTLDEKSPVRKRFPSVRALYEDLARGIILLDNRRQPRRFDIALALLLAASTASGIIADQSLSPANALAYVFDRNSRTRYATLSIFGESLPVYHLPAWKRVLPEVFYTKASVLEEKLIRGTKLVKEQPELQAAPLERSAVGHTRLALGVAPVQPLPDFQRSARRVADALETWRKQDQDVMLQFASIAFPLSKESSEVPMFVVFLQGLEADSEAVDALALGAPVADKFLPQTVPPSSVKLLPKKTARRTTKKES